MDRPTGNEPWTPVRIRETSVTERATFKKCRRQWLLTVVHRVGGGGLNENFWLGELVHTGLEAYYRHDLAACGCARREKCAHAARAMLDAYAAAANRALDEVRSETGFLWDEFREPWERMDQLGALMLRGYVLYDREQGGLGEVESVETRYRVRIPGTRGRLTLRVDLVTLRRLRDRIRRTVVDHKSASGKPSEAFHDVDDQFTAYHWGYAAATGLAVDRVLRNVLLKRAPEPPKLIRKGRELSRDRRAPTTLSLYLEAIDANGFDRDDYADHLDYLAARGWEDFFARQDTFRTRGQLEEFERNLVLEWRDMARVALHPEQAYPNPSPLHCPSCPVRAVCASMMDKGDTAGLLRSEFVILPPRE